MKCDCIQSFLTRFFRRLALLTARHPKKFIAFPILFTLLCSPGAFLNFHFLEGIEYQYTPKHGRAIPGKRRMYELFPMNYSTQFSPSRQIEFLAYGRLIIESKDGGSVLRPHIFEEILEVDRRVKDLTIHKEGLEWRFQHLCAREGKACYEPELLKLKPSIKDISNGIYKVEYPVHVDRNKNTFQGYSMSLGGVELDSGNHIISSKAASLAYFLDGTTPKFTDLNKEWEDMFLKLGELYTSDNITLYRIMSRTLDEEFGADTFSSMMYFVLTVCLMLFFSVVTSMMSDCVRSKPWLGVLGCISSTLAVGAAFSLLLLCKVEFVVINLVIPFLLLGIGLDDSFVIMAAWRRTDPAKSVEERMVDAYQHAGVSITVTSFTNLISFLMGATTPYYAANLLCFYAALSVSLAYVYQLCFFGGFFALFGYAEERNLHCFTLREATPKSLARHRGKWFQLCCTGGRDAHNPDNPEDNRDHLGMVFFRDYLGRWLSRPRIKMAVFLVYVIYLAAAVYGCLLITEGINIDQIFGEGTYGNEFAVKDKLYFYNYIMRYQVVIDEPLDYSDKAVQQKYLDTIAKLEGLPFSSHSNLTEAWLKHYLEFLEDKRSNLLTFWRYNLSNKADFYECLKKDFFKHPLFKNYKYDVVFDENGTDILASRFFYQAEGIKDFVMLQKLTVNLWDQIDSLPLKVFTYHPMYYFVETETGLPQITYKTVAITGVVMMIIAFAFMPQLTASTWVAFAVVSIEIGLFGFMPYWDINLNAPTMVTLVISVGFSVDNAAHITYAYIFSKKQDPDAKMRDALYYVGVPISQACVSTIIGVALLLLTPSHTFHLFSKMMIVLMCFALFHSLILLPILLALTESLCLRSPIFKRQALKQNSQLKGSEHGTSLPFLSKNHEEIPS